MKEKLGEDFWVDLFGGEIKPLQPGEITTAMVAKKIDTSMNCARYKIKKLAEQGKLRSVGKRRTEGGYVVEAWQVI